MSGIAAVAPQVTSRPARERDRAAGWFAVDAAVTATTAIAYVFAGGPVEDLTGLSPGTGRAIGLGLLGFAAVVALVATRRGPRRLARAVAAANAVWVLASLAVAAGGALDLSTFGRCWTVAQAAAVGALAALQVAGLRASRPT
jgi:hypothetical protein